MIKDSTGFAPKTANQCDAHEDCLGWVLCHHAGTGRCEGWCTQCDAPAEAGFPIWTWCPERIN